MALERIDPISLEDCYAVDHLLRYAIAAPLVKGKRVLDAASGLGFGSVHLLHQEATEVVGVDLSSEAIDISRERWPHPGLKFFAHDLETLGELDLGKFDLVTTFETLEHVENPDRIVGVFKDHLDESGLVFGSVPGRTDRKEENAFHLHHFDAASLEALLRAHFGEVLIFRQDFSIRSRLKPIDGVASGESLRWVDEANLEIDFGRAGEDEDSLVFMASNAKLPPVDALRAASSRNAWLRMRSAYLEALQDLDSFSTKYRTLFHEHGDLKVKFANMLGWGQWHFEQLNGRNPTDTEIERVAKAMSRREMDLREQVTQLQEELLEMKGRLAETEDLLGKSSRAHLETFEGGSKSLKQPD